MRASKLATFVLLCSSTFGTVANAQTSQPTAASLDAQAQTVLQMLTDPDFPVDADSKGPLTAKWIELTCQSKSLKFQQSGIDAETASAIYKKCTARMKAHSATELAAAKKSKPPAAPTQNPAPATAGGAKMPSVAGNIPCVLIGSPATTSGSDSTYSYSVQCPANVSPNSMAIVTPLISNPVGFALEQGIDKQSSNADNDKKTTTFSFTFNPGADARKLSLTVPTASIDEKSVPYYIASGAITDATTISSTKSCSGFASGTCSIATVTVPIPKAPKAVAATCPSDITDKTLPTATLDPVASGDSQKISGKIDTAQLGKLATGIGATVQVCADNSLVGVSATVDATKGTFEIDNAKLKPGQKMVAEVILTDSSGTKTYGVPSPSDGVPVDSCSKAASGTGTGPTLNLSQKDDSGAVAFSGTANVAKPTTVRVCVNDVPVLDKSGKEVTATTDANGTFNSGTTTFQVKADDKIVAQTESSDAPKTYGHVSDPPKQVTSAGVVVDGSNVGAGGGTKTPCGNGYWYYSCGFSTIIGGVEWAGYSAETLTTNGFLSGYWRSRYVWKDPKKDPKKDPNKTPSALGVALWGRVRLLSAPQPSSNGISFTSTFANPTGSITTSQLQNVGQAIDYVLGLEMRLHQWDDTTYCRNLDGNGKCNDSTKIANVNSPGVKVTSKSATRISLVFGGGATTPLTANNNNDLSTFNAPAVNSPECLAFAKRYPPSPGVAGVYLNTNQSPTTCLMNPLDKSDKNNPAGFPISYVSFTNPDRTNFYGKYGAGFRITRIYNATGPNSKPYSGSLDVTIGQDQSMSAGKWWGPVLRADGVWPIALGSSSLFYVFGSAGMRTGNNVTYPPIILTTPASGSSPAVPGQNVTVLDFQVPARDFYRIGIGLNIIDLFCKMKPGSCPADSGANSAGATASNKTPSTGGGGATTPAQPSGNVGGATTPPSSPTTKPTPKQ